MKSLSYLESTMGEDYGKKKENLQSWENGDIDKKMKTEILFPQNSFLEIIF